MLSASTHAQANYRCEHFEMMVSTSFGEMEDPDEESKLAMEYEIHHKILLEKIGKKVRRKIVEFYKASDLKTTTYSRDKRRMMELFVSRFDIGKIYFSYSSEDSITSKKEMDLRKMIQECIKDADIYGTFEKRILKHPEWKLSVKKRETLLNLTYGEYIIRFNKDYTFEMRPTDMLVDEMPTIYGYWYLWNAKIFKMFAVTDTKIPVARMHDEITGEQRTEWSIKNTGPDYFELMILR